MINHTEGGEFFHTETQEKKSLFSSLKKKFVTVTSLFKKDSHSPTDVAINK